MARWIVLAALCVSAASCSPTEQARESVAPPAPPKQEELKPGEMPEWYTAFDRKLQQEDLKPGEVPDWMAEILDRLENEKPPILMGGPDDQRKRRILPSTECIYLTNPGRRCTTKP